MSSVPVWTVVATGVVLSVKVPKVPRPATAAAVPAMASEPTTFRVLLRRVLALMSVSPCVRCATGIPATGRTLSGQPQGTRPESARNPQGSFGKPSDRPKTPDFRSYDAWAAGGVVGGGGGGGGEGN